MENKPNVLKILQGVPGPEKSEYIKRQTCSRNWPMYAMVCSDQQYTPELLKGYDANFLSDVERLQKSPATLCFRRAVRLVTGGAPFLIIDNLNLHISEVSPYVYLALAFGYEYMIVHVETPVAIEESLEIVEARERLKAFSVPEGWNRTSVLVEPHSCR